METGSKGPACKGLAGVAPVAGVNSGIPRYHVYDAYRCLTCGEENIAWNNNQQTETLHLLSLIRTGCLTINGTPIACR